MAKGKGKITPFITWNHSSDNNNANNDPMPGSSSSARHFSSSVFPGLQRLDTSASTSGRPSRPVSVPPSASSSRSGPTPILSLKLSGPSFLDVVIRDRENKDPLYLIETKFESTSIYRLNTSTSQATKVSTIQWPTSVTRSRHRSGRTVQMGSERWRDTEEFLKHGPLGNLATRKFHIPHYSHSLKWKLIPGGHFYCSTAGAKGPFAVLDSAVFNAPARLSIFHNCLEDDEAASQENYKGIPVLLLDYLVVTAMLLTTEVQEWLDRPQTLTGTVHIPGVSANTVQKWLSIIHNTPHPASPTSSPAETPVTSEVLDISNHDHSGTGSASTPASATPIENPSSPSTPATSSRSSFFPQNEQVPPVPPLPAELPPQPKRNSIHDPSMIHPFAHPYASTSTPNLRKSPSKGRRSTQGALPSGVPSTRVARRLPAPPTPPSAAPFSPPERSWISMEMQHLHDLAISPPVPDGERSHSPSLHSNSSESTASGSHRSHHRNSARSSLGRALPPALPPPSQALPLPPKLAQEMANSATTSSSQQQHHAPGREPHDALSPPIIAHHGTSALQAINPDPLTPEEEEQIRALTNQMVTLNATSGYGAGGGSACAYPSVGVLSTSNGVPPDGYVDAGMVVMRDARTTTSYAETVFDVPPPAYDAIDFSLPHVRLTQRGR